MLHFREEQRFRQGWVWTVVAAVTGLTFFTFGYAIYQQVVLHRPWGDHPISNEVLVGTALAIFLLDAAVIWLLYSATLITEVRADGLYVQFYPFHLRVLKFPFDRIRRWEARFYNPIGEFGGWGIRWGRTSKAYNVFGDRGVELEFTDGSRLLIGSQRAEDLASALSTARNRFKTSQN
ncbi:MAG: DUF6141 family protein [bacterium JZ-2024 1]